MRCAPLDGAPGPDTLAAWQAALDRLTDLLGIPGLRVVADPSDLWSAELAISGRLGLAPWAAEPERLADLASEAVEQVVASASGRALVARTLHSGDGTALRCYAYGDLESPAVVLVSACGMPVGLVEGWVRHLANAYRVITWESRDLFEDDGNFDAKRQDLAVQVGDVLAVLDGFDLHDAHLMGLCGGAAMALGAAASPRVRSLSLWHGDYELGGDAPKTQHQRDVHALLTMAGRSRRSAAGLHELFRKPATLAKMPPDLAPYLLYPYANAELLYRYGRLNGAIMGTDCRPLLAAVGKPTLVVTSEDDTTAHPQGSVYAAARLEQGRLEVLVHGDHLAAFEGGPERRILATSFLDEMVGRP
jgi:3-oxoadipate enol-lactonase